MQLTKWNEDFPKDPSLINKALKLLHERHIIYDSDNVYGSTEMEHCQNEIEEELRRSGYVGGRLIHLGRYDDGVGATYAFFDSEALSWEDANLALKKTAEAEYNNFSS